MRRALHAAALVSLVAPAVAGTQETAVLPSGEIRGRVFWVEKDQPIEVEVVLKDTTGQVRDTAKAGPDGRFSFSHVAPGSYVLTAELMDTNPVFDPCSSIGIVSSYDGWGYNVLIRGGRIAGQRATSDPFEVSDGGVVEMDVPFAYECVPN